MPPATRSRADRTRWLQRQLGTLAIAHVQSANPMAPVRAAAWANSLGRLGLYLPLFVVHDVGLLLTAPAGAATIGPRAPLLDALRLSFEAKNLLGRYQSLLQAVADSEVVEKAASYRLRDELVAVLLGRILGDVFHRFADP